MGGNSVKLRRLTLLTLSAFVCTSVGAAYAECSIAGIRQENQSVFMDFSSDLSPVNIVLMKNAPEGESLKPAEKHKKYVLAADSIYAEGKQTYSFDMPEEYGGDATTGYYTMFLKEQGGDRVEKEFYFLNTKDRKLFLNEVKAYSDTSEIIKAADEKNDTYHKFVGLGFPIDCLSESNSEDIASYFINNKSLAEEGELKRIFSEGVALNYIKNGASTKQIFRYLDLNFEGTAYNNISDSKLLDYIEKYYDKNKADINSGKDISSAYKTANIMYLINNAKSGNLSKLIEANAESLGISALNEYSVYNKMTNSNKSSVNDKIVQQKSNNEIYYVSDFRTLFSNSVLTVSGEKTEVIKPSNGGGGSSGGGGGFSPSYTKDELNLLTKNENKETGNAEKTVDFDDLDSVNWAKSAIISLAKKGIVNGVGDNKFNPNASVKREEFVKMLVISLNAELKTTNKFIDVSEEEWYSPYIGAAAENEICSGISEEEFGIGRSITREDAAVMLYRAFRNRLNSIRDAKTFSDANEISSYAKEAIAALYSAGIIDGSDAEHFSPQNSITRAEAAKLINGIIERN